MLPLELDGKTPWPLEKAHMVIAELRDKRRRDLLDRDIARGLPGGATTRMVDVNGKPTLTVDPILSALKSTGEEFNALWVNDYHDFCENPQDSKAYKQPRPERPKVPKSVEMLLGVGPVQSAVMELATAPRKRGRPRNVDRELEERGEQLTAATVDVRA